MMSCAAAAAAAAPYLLLVYRIYSIWYMVYAAGLLVRVSVLFWLFDCCLLGFLSPADPLWWVW